MPKGIYPRNYDGKYKIAENGCWLWLGFIEANGYGARVAHRRVYERYRGAIPAGLQIDHLCRVRRCVNPDHLEAVTAAENTRRSNVAKLSPDQVEQIRGLAGDLRHHEIAQQFGVHQSTITRIINGKRWKDGAQSRQSSPR